MPWAQHTAPGPLTLPQSRSEAPPLPASSRQPRVTCSPRGPAEGRGSRAELSRLGRVTAWRRGGLVWVPGAGLSALVSLILLPHPPRAGPGNGPHKGRASRELCWAGSGGPLRASVTQQGGRVLDSALRLVAGSGHSLQLEPPAFPPGLALGASSLGLPGRRLAPYFLHKADTSLSSRPSHSLWCPPSPPPTARTLAQSSGDVNPRNSFELRPSRQRPPLSSSLGVCPSSCVSSTWFVTSPSLVMSHSLCGRQWGHSWGDVPH